MRTRKNEPIRITVNDKEREIIGKKAYPENLLDAFERIVEETKDSTVNCQEEYLKYYNEFRDFDGEHRPSTENIEIL